MKLFVYLFKTFELNPFSVDDFDYFLHFVEKHDMLIV